MTRPVEGFRQLETRLSIRRPRLLPVVRRGLVILDQRIREFAQGREEVRFQEHPRFTAVATSRRSICLSRKELARKALGAPVDEIRKLCEEGLKEIASFPPVSEVKRELLSCLAAVSIHKNTRRQE